MGADPGNREDHEEQRRRELEEIRDSFRQIGIRMGSLFEPAQERSSGTGEAQASGPQEAEPGPAEGQAHAPALGPRPRRRALSWAAPAAIALVCLLAGGGLGYYLHGPPASPELTPTVITQTVVRTETKPVAPRACLEAARRGDESIDLLLRNVRDRRLSLALKAYTTASQACRQEASP
ncbi:MAG TPA: hypothetical protein VFA45_25635 [Actinomycetes bacterium]|jgi:hypothetical protein|nr:hypothetical protein [Actinomycetes bacterium]